MNGSGELAQFELLAKAIFASETSPRDRAQANQALVGFTESGSYIQTCEMILERSKEPYALLLAATSLKKLMTTYWNKFSKEQTVEIRNYLLNKIGNCCTEFPVFVTTALVQVLVRITKLGWEKDAAHREICTQVSKFLEYTPQHCRVGLQILSELVNEMNTQYSGQTYTVHRKLAVSFRDQSLLSVFRSTLDMLKRLKATPETEETSKLVIESLKVAMQCLNFDYIGTNADDSSEDGGVMQVPSSWRTLMEDPTTLSTIFDVFRSSVPPTATLCVEVLVLLSATRQSLFTSKESRVLFFSNICRGTVEMIKTRADALSDGDCYHQFCRLLGRLKSNLQLEDLCKMEGHEEWIKLVADVTIRSFEAWAFASHSVPYLMGLWARLTLDLPYMRGGLPDFLLQFIPKIVEVFMEQRVASIATAVANNDLDEVFEMHEVSLKHLPTIFKFQYEQSAESLKLRFEKLLRSYQECMERLMTPGGDTEPNRMQLCVIENQLAVCLYVIGSLIGYQRNVGPAKAMMERLDSEMCALFFRLMPMLDLRLSKDFRVMGSRHLELAILTHLENFRKRYMTMPSTFRGPLYSDSAVSEDGTDGAPTVPAPMPRIFPGTEGDKDDADIFSQVSQMLGSTVDQKTTLSAILNKILMNLKLWANDQRILEGTLALFREFSSTQFSCKTLSEIDTCQSLLKNHSVEHFRFLKNPKYHRHVTAFYAILARLAFKLDTGDCFEEFMMPFEAMFQQLSTACFNGNLRTEQARVTAIQACRQLSGVVLATAMKKNYMNVFDWIYPKYLNVLVRLLETWWDTPDVTTPILRFYSELVWTRSQRICFSASSPNGILLFKETSKILSIYATRILTVQQTQDVHKEKLKGVMLCLQILQRSLNGNYINFGVFALYNDPALKKAFDNVLTLVMSEPLDVYIAYAKVAKEFFNFLRVLYANHLDVLSGPEPKVFLALTSALHEGLHSFDTQDSDSCALALDFLFVFIHKNSRSKRDPKAKAIALKLKEHLDHAGTMLHEILASLFNRILFDNIQNLWGMTRVTHSLLVISRESFTIYQQKLIARQPAEAQLILNEAFAKLVEGVEANVETSNREVFSNNLRAFSTTVSKFCISPR